MSFLSRVRDNVRNILPSLTWLLGPPPPTAPFTAPTYNDVCQTRALLKSLKLPTELVLSILDHAQYWPIQEVTRGGGQATARGNRPSAASLCLSANVFETPAVTDAAACGERAKIKKIEFDVKSHDQGWTSGSTQGTFSTSSWLEVSILRGASNNNSGITPVQRPDAWICPQDYHTDMIGHGWSLVNRPESALQGPQGGEGNYAWYLQGNRVATRESEEYRIVWTEQGCEEGNQGSGSGEGFLQALREGDRVLVWARAKYPGWQCFVEDLNVTIKYGF